MMHTPITVGALGLAYGVAVAAAGPAIFHSSDTCKVHRVPSLVGIIVRTVRQELAGPHRHEARCLDDVPVPRERQHSW